MKPYQTHYLFCTLFFLFALALLPATIQAQTATKEFNETFKVSGSDKLQIDNSFGNITITHWNKKEASIRVVVEAESRNEKRKEEMLNRVQITIRKSGNTISGITRLQENTNNNKDRLNINYLISIPSDMEVSLEQKYGNISMPSQTNGKSEIILSFGNLKAGSFNKPLNINAKYSNLDMENIEEAKIHIEFCGNVTFTSGKSLRINNKYSTLKIKTVKEMHLDLSFGKLKLDSGEKLDISSSYSDVEIGHVQKELVSPTLSFGKMLIKELSKDFTRFKVNGNYGKLTVSIPSQLSFNIDAKGFDYGSFKIKNFNITSSDTDNDKYYKYEVNGGNRNKIIEFNGNGFSNIEIKNL